jgi:hypothetical protein
MSLLEDYLSQNEVKVELHTCNHCNGKGSIMVGLQEGFIKVSNKILSDVQKSLEEHNYYSRIIISSHFYSWLEITKIQEVDNVAINT